MKKWATIWILSLTICGMFSCRVTSHLKPGEYLYNGAKVKINAPDKLVGTNKKQLREQLIELLRPKPNSKILGVPFKLWVYNVAGEPKHKGFRNWLKNKVGEPPVLASMSIFEKNRAVLQNRLDNRGFFSDTVKLDTVSKGKKMTAIYEAETGPQYTLRNVTYPVDSSDMNKLIQTLAKRSLLKTGDPYDLDMIKNERTRLDARLKQRGYYYFNPDYIVTLADSTVGENKVDLRILVKRSTPVKAKETYKINDVIVYADYEARTDTNITVLSAKKYEGYTIIDPQEKFKPSIFGHALIFK
ncbi:MAG TPA: POTRA domain-containing protein, partial [Puia sp.]|nr:POTRA domain-containing protein [Puia sp.]